MAIFAEERGTGRSEGVMKDYFDAQSYQDGYDLVTWAADQPWSDGKVGVWGISFGAITLGPPGRWPARPSTSLDGLEE